MTVIAQLDTAQTPPVVTALYNYLDPTYMVAPKWMDVTNIKPAVQTGCTYTAATQAWTYPAHPESLLTWAKAQLATNNIFLALVNPTPVQTEAQLIALTVQQTRILNRRIGGS
jgi:hypothetical protein